MNITTAAISVLPRPVGRQTSVLASSAVRAIRYWYSRTARFRGYTQYLRWQRQEVQVWKVWDEAEWGEVPCKAAAGGIDEEFRRCLLQTTRASDSLHVTLKSANYVSLPSCSGHRASIAPSHHRNKIASNSDNAEPPHHCTNTLLNHRTTARRHRCTIAPTRKCTVAPKQH